MHRISAHMSLADYATREERPLEELGKRLREN